MSKPPYGQVDVKGAEAYNGLRVDHPGLLEATQNLLKKGYGNEHIVRIVGVPPAVIERERERLKKLRASQL